MLGFPLTKSSAAFTLLLMGFAAAVAAQTLEVFEVKVARCIQAPAERSQTGFRLRNYLGVFTALHGVIGCQTITLDGSGEGYHPREPVQIVRVDIDSDIALLSSPELAAGPLGGLAEAPRQDIDSIGEARKVFVQGFPLGISGGLRTSLEVRSPALVALRAILPANVQNALRDRSSPNLMVKILSIQGDLLPGHSGAPILDAKGQVLAIADGGLQLGAQIGWAVPMNEIHFSTNLTSPRLALLRQARVDQLFAFDTRRQTGSASPPPLAAPSMPPGNGMRFSPFTLTLLSCEHLGANLACSLRIENTGSSKANLALQYGSSFAYDEQGSEFHLEQATVGSRGWSGDQFGAVTFEPNLPVKAHLVFKAVPDAAHHGSLQLVLAVVATGGPQAFFGPNPQWRSVIFRSIPFKS